MNGRLLLALVAGLLLLIAPLATRGGAAMAMAPTSNHHPAAMTDGHCSEQSSQDQGDQSAEKSCCLAMCTAIASLPSAMTEPPVLAEAMDRPPLDHFRHGYLAKLPTPPPRTHVKSN